MNNQNRQRFQKLLGQIPVILSADRLPAIRACRDAHAPRANGHGFLLSIWARPHGLPHPTSDTYHQHERWTNVGFHFRRPLADAKGHKINLQLRTRYGSSSALMSSNLFRLCTLSLGLQLPTEYPSTHRWNMPEGFRAVYAGIVIPTSTSCPLTSIVGGRLVETYGYSKFYRNNHHQRGGWFCLFFGVQDPNLGKRPIFSETL